MEGIFSWETIATISGATAFVLLVCQVAKVPLDKVWKIPTRAFAYILAVISMTVANVFMGAQTPDLYVMVFINAVIVTAAAMGAYEATFKKIEIPQA